MAMGAAGKTASTHWYSKLGDTEIIFSYQLEGVRYDKSGEKSTLRDVRKGITPGTAGESLAGNSHG